jgi:16S rRNA (cytosine1402-N4)-methyltransferase
MAVPFDHEPVLCDRVVAWLRPAAPGLLVDATLGLGGHSLALLRSEPGFRLLGIDRDPEAVAEAQQRLHPFADRIQLVTGTFDSLPEFVASVDDPEPAAILADLGCSSLQLDRPERGFSFLHDGPLDMRMGSDGPTAADLVSGAPEEELVSILRTYGEERRARPLARAIVGARRRTPITTTGELCRLVERVVGRSRVGRIHPATRTFQALRIAVNDELGQLDRFLEPAIRTLRPGGRLAAISFHSLEDRVVKHTFRRLEGRCVCPPDLPECRCQPETLVRVLTGRPERPTAEEIAANPRSRSARLRVAERLGEA